MLYVSVRLEELFNKSSLCSIFFILLYNIFIEFGTKLYRHIVGIPMGIDCTPFIADLFFHFAMNEILWPLFLTIKKLKLFKHLTLHLDI